MADEHDTRARPPSGGDVDGEAPSGRPKRSSVRPSAFGPPRGAGSSEAPPPSEPKLADPYPEDTLAETGADEDPYALTPSTTPSALELVSQGLFSGTESSPDSSDGWTPLGTRQNVFPTLGYDPFRSVDSQPPPSSDPDSEELSVPPPPFEETEVTSPSLVAARSGLLPIPEAPDETPRGTPVTGEESALGGLSVALFVLMFLGAGGVLVAQWPAGQGAQTPAARHSPQPSMAAGQPAERAVAARPPASETPQPAPLVVETPKAILAKVEPGLPADPDDAAAKLLAYAHSYLEEKQPDVAAALLARAAELDSNNLPVRVELGRIALALEDHEAAQRSLEEATSMAPRDFTARLLLGDVYAAQGNVKRARRHWRRAERLQPQSEAVRERLEQ